MQARLQFLGLVLCCCGRDAAAPEPKAAAAPVISASASAPTAAPVISASASAPAPAEDPAYAQALSRICAAIAGLKASYPQLSEFTAKQHCSEDRLVISYGRRTTRAARGAGWRSGVPSPEPGGVWFHIDLHDPDSRSQLHTQPVVPTRRFRDKVLFLLLVDGADTRPLGPDLAKILDGLDDAPPPSQK